MDAGLGVEQISLEAELEQMETLLQSGRDEHAVIIMIMIMM